MTERDGEAGGPDRRGRAVFRGSGRGRQQVETQEPETREARLGNRDRDGKKNKEEGVSTQAQGLGLSSRGAHSCAHVVPA